MCPSSLRLLAISATAARYGPLRVTLRLRAAAARSMVTSARSVSYVSYCCALRSAARDAAATRYGFAFDGDKRSVSCASNVSASEPQRAAVAQRPQAKPQRAAEAKKAHPPVVWPPGEGTAASAMSKIVCC